MTGGVDPTILTAFAVGVISFLSPCVLPLVPGYLSAVSGVSVADLQTGRPDVARRVIGPATIFCLTFSLVFVALGLTATGLGAALSQNRQTLNTIAGAVIVALGLFFVLAPLFGRLNREWRVEALMRRAGTGGPLVAGAAFAVAWTPCVGPTLGAILTAAGAQQSVSSGVVLLICYSLGLAVPFLVTALAFTRATAAFAVVKRHQRLLNVLSGAILIGMGLLLLTDQLTELNAAAQSLLERLDLDFYNL